MFTDGMNMFKVITNASTEAEKRLMIDNRAARKAYEKNDIKHLGGINLGMDIADGLTKFGKCEVLETVLHTVVIDLEADNWVERTELTFYCDIRNRKENPGESTPRKIDIQSKSGTVNYPFSTRSTS